MITETVKARQINSERKNIFPNIQVSTQTFTHLGGVALLLGGVLGATAQAIHPADPDNAAALAEYARVGQPVHLLLFVAVMLVLLGLPAVCVRQSHKAGLLGLGGFVLLFFGLPLMDLLHSVIDFMLLPTLVARVPDQIMPIFMATEEDPFFAVVMMISMPMLLLGTLTLAIATLRARVLSPWPAWLLLATGAIAIIGFFIRLPELIDYLHPIMFYLGLAGLGAALLTDKATGPATLDQLG